MIYAMYDVDISDGDELSYRQQVIKHFGIIVMIINPYGPGGGNPQCCLIGKKEDLIEFCEDENLGFGDTIENLGLNINEFFIEKVKFTPNEIIREIFI